MKNFTYYPPKSVEEAVGLLDKTWGKTELLAGGPHLLDLQKEYIAQPEKVVSLSGIAMGDAKDLAKELGVVRIGAGIKLADLAAAPEVRIYFPSLATAAGLIGGPQIRNMGTLGGNLCQRN